MDGYKRDNAIFNVIKTNASGNATKFGNQDTVCLNSKTNLVEGEN